MLGSYNVLICAGRSFAKMQSVSWQLYLSKLSNIFVQIDGLICLNFEMYLLCEKFCKNAISKLAKPPYQPTKALHMLLPAAPGSTMKSICSTLCKGANLDKISFYK